MKEIQLSQGKIAVIDDDDFERVNQYKWFLSGKTTNYAMAYVKGSGRENQRRIFLHRFIVNCPEGFQVDHINNNKMDNRKENLRITDSFGNNRNRSISSRNTSGYKGVSFKNNAFEAYINFTYLGRYKTAEEAALVYNKAAKKRFGVFAKLNEVKTL
jgi:hypothetical protein